MMRATGNVCHPSRVCMRFPLSRLVYATTRTKPIVFSVALFLLACCFSLTASDAHALTGGETRHLARQPKATGATVVLVDAMTEGYYNDAIGTVLDGTQPQIPLANSAGGDPRILPAPEPDLATAATILGDWLSPHPLPLDSNWSGLDAIPLTWAVNTETAIVYPIHAGEEGIINLRGNFGVDNGIFVWVNGEYKFGALAPGGASAFEYTNIDLGSLPPGWNFIQILREDHGGFTGYVVEIIGTYTDDRWYVDCSVPVSGDGRSWPTAFKTVQEGLDAAGEGEEIIVAPGTYPETIQFQGRNVILHSTDPSDPKIVASTIIINGGAQTSVVKFTGVETPECILFGFTILNGNGDYGGGICGGSEETHTLATIRNNTITQNQAIHDGGGIAFCDGVIENNVISENAAGENGGGLHDCQAIVRNNDIVGNIASLSGGGLHRCDAPIEDNTITDNQAAQDGGGLCDCQGTIRGNIIMGNNAIYSGGGMYLCHGPIANNTISGNAAARGGGLDECDGTIENNIIENNSVSYGGGGLAWCEGTVQNNIIRGNTAFYGGGLAWGEGIIQTNLIVDNKADDRGGGLERCEGLIRNNTIVSNTAADRGGGLADCPGSILNCIIWGNTAGHLPQLSNSSGPAYCCIEGWGGGQGNLTMNPAFVDPDGADDDPCTYEDNDYHLTTGSPCIDVGMNETWMWNAVDLDGHLRIHFGAFSLTVDVGAYETASSVFRVVAVTRTTEGGIRLAWSSGLEESYSVWVCHDLARGSWIRVNEDPIPSAGQITTWTVPAGAYPCMFYRIALD